jgi:hypothetical protein
MTYYCGFNVLDAAMSIIGSSAVTLYVSNGSTVNADGSVSNFYTAKHIKANIQPMGSREINDMGLDQAQRYCVIYTNGRLRGHESVDQTSTGDCFVYLGNKYRIKTVEDWEGQNGWCQGIAVLNNDLDFI